MVFLGKDKKKKNLFSIIAILFTVIALGLIAYFSIKQISASPQETPKTKVIVAINNWDEAGQPKFYKTFDNKTQFRCTDLTFYVENTDKTTISKAIKDIMDANSGNKIIAGASDLTQTIDSLLDEYNNDKQKALNDLNYSVIINSSFDSSGKLRLPCDRGGPGKNASKVYEVAFKIPTQYQATAAAPVAATDGTYACLKFSDSVFTTYILSSGSLWTKLNSKDKGETPVTRNGTKFNYSGAGTGANKSVTTYDLKGEGKCTDTGAPAANAPVATSDGSTVLTVKVVNNAGKPVAGAYVDLSQITKTEPGIKSLDTLWKNNEFRLRHTTSAEGIYKFQWDKGQFVYKDDTNPSAQSVTLKSATVEISANTKDKGPVTATTTVVAGTSSEVKITLPVGVPNTAAAGKSPVLLAPVQTVKPQVVKADFPSGGNSIEFRPVRYSEAGFADKKAPIGGVSYTLEVETKIASERDNPELANKSENPFIATADLVMVEDQNWCDSLTDASKCAILSLMCLEGQNENSLLKYKIFRKMTEHAWVSTVENLSISSSIAQLARVDKSNCLADQEKLASLAGIGPGGSNSGNKITTAENYWCADLGNNKQTYVANLTDLTMTAVSTGLPSLSIIDPGMPGTALPSTVTVQNQQTKQNYSATKGMCEQDKFESQEQKPSGAKEEAQGSVKISDEGSFAKSLAKGLADKLKDWKTTVSNWVKPKEEKTYIYSFTSKTIDNGVNSRTVIDNLPDGKYKLTLSKPNFGENVFIASIEISGSKDFRFGDSGDIYLVANSDAEPPSAPTAKEETVTSIKQDGKNIIHEIVVGNDTLGYVESAAGYGWQKKDATGKYKTEPPNFEENSGSPKVTETTSEPVGD